MKLSYKEIPDRYQALYNIYRDPHTWTKEGYVPVTWEHTFLFTVTSLKLAEEICSLGQTPEKRNLNFRFMSDYKRDCVYVLNFSPGARYNPSAEPIAEFNTFSKLEAFFEMPPNLVRKEKKRVVIISIHKNTVTVSLSTGETVYHYVEDLQALTKKIDQLRNEYINDHVVMS